MSSDPESPDGDDYPAQESASGAGEGAPGTSGADSPSASNPVAPIYNAQPATGSQSDLPPILHGQNESRSLGHESPALGNQTPSLGNQILGVEIPPPGASAEQGTLGAPLSEPQLLHPSSVIFETLSHVRQYIIPTIIGLITAARGSWWGAGIALIVFAGAVLFTLIRYFTLRYRIHENEFVVTEGLLFRRVRSVPIRRIQNVDLIQNLFHRAFGVAEVNIETASGTKPEATLRVLTRRQVEELRHAIFGSAGEDSESESSFATPGSDVAPAESVANPANIVPGSLVQGSLATGSKMPSDAAPVGLVPDPRGLAASSSSATHREEIYRIPLRQLVLAGLTSNRGTVLLGVLVGFYFQGGFTDDYDFDGIGQFLPQYESTAALVWMAILGFLALMLILRIVGICWYVLRFYDFRLSRFGEDLRISCGLFTKVSATVPRKRIQFISVHRPFMLKWFDLACIRIETAGGAGSEDENAAATVSRRWFLPVVKYSEVNRILAVLRPELVWDDAQIEWHGVSPLTGRRLFRIVLIVSVLLSAVGLAATRPWGFLLGIAIFPLLLVIARKKSKAKRYGKTDWGIAYQSGLLTKKLSFAFYDRIQVLRVSQSPFDRRWRMASLLVDTAAAGPAQHVIDISFLDSNFANAQLADLKNRAAAHRPSWS